LIEVQISDVFRIAGDAMTGTAILLQLHRMCMGALRLVSLEQWARCDPPSSRFVGEWLELRLQFEPPLSGPLRKLIGAYARYDPATEELSTEWLDLRGELNLPQSLLVLELGDRRLKLLEAVPLDVANRPYWSDFFLRQMATVNPWQLLVNHERLQGPLKRFLAISDFNTNMFVMMRFRETHESTAIREAIRDGLSRHGLHARFADELGLADDLWDNVAAYMCWCRFGVAVVEEIEERSFNPNVAIEVGFMQALQRPVLVLKDKRVPPLPTDLAGRLYREFDSYDIAPTIGKAIDGWIGEANILGLLPRADVLAAEWPMQR
jgi:hypothetical protein